MYFRLQSDPEINAFGSFVCKCGFGENYCFFLSKVNVFQVWSYQKSHQNRVQNMFEKKLMQKSNFEWIWAPFLEVSEHQIASKRLRKSKSKKALKIAVKRPPRALENHGFLTPGPYCMLKHLFIHVSKCSPLMLQGPCFDTPGHRRAVRRIFTCFGGPKSMKNRSKIGTRNLFAFWNAFYWIFGNFQAILASK